jgi:putative DNA primase/helicase
MVVTSAVAAMSAAVQGHVDVRRDGQLCGPVSVNTLVIADSGERKTGCDSAFSAAAERWARAEAKRLGVELAKAREARDAHQAHKQGLLAAIRETAAKSKKAAGGMQKVENQADLEALKKQLKDHARGLPPLPPQPTPRIENGTAEGVANVLRFAWPAVAWASNEGATVTGGHAFKDDALLRTLAFLNSRWDGTPIDRARAAEDYSKVYGRRLTVSLMLQPAAFEAFNAAGGGLARGLGNLARMLVAWPRSTMGTRLRDEDGGDPELPALGRFLARAEELHRLPLPMPFDMETMEADLDEDGDPVVDPLELGPRELPLGPEARRLWIRYLNECERELAPEGEFAEVRDVAAKSAENACRLAAVFHVWRHGSAGRVGADDMARGVEVARWFLFEARRVLSGAGEPETTPERVADAEVLARWIDARDEAPTLKDVLRLAPPRLRHKDRRDAALALLRERHWLRHERRGGKMVLALNPNLPWED